MRMQVEHGFEIYAFSVTNAGILFASKGLNRFICPNGIHGLRNTNMWMVNNRNAQMKGGNVFWDFTWGDKYKKALLFSRGGHFTQEVSQFTVEGWVETGKLEPLHVSRKGIEFSVHIQRYIYM